MLNAADFKKKTLTVHFQLQSYKRLVNHLLSVEVHVSPLLRTRRSASELQFRAIVKTEGNILRIFVISTCTVFSIHFLLCVMSSRISISSLSF